MNSLRSKSRKYFHPMEKMTGLNLTKEAKNFCTKNYKELLNKIKVHTNTLKDNRVERFNSLLLQCLPKTIYRVNAILTKSHGI